MNDDAVDVAPPERELGQISVLVRNVSIHYRTETTEFEEFQGLRRALARAVNAVGLTTYGRVEALRDVSLVVREGEHVGIVGANGSGKSTLLRVIAGVEPPVRGAVLASASPVLLGVNAALLPALTGARNVRLGLLALGFRPDDVEDLFPQVVKIAGIGAAVNRPMRTYSSGMAARLRFAIAASANPSILLIDEALGTGDAAFATRSQQIIDGLRKRAGTIFLVSHAAKTIEEMCTRAIWLHQGELILDGAAVAVARAYRWWAHNIAEGNELLAADLLAAARGGSPVVP